MRTTLGISLPAELKRAAERQAKREHRSLSSLISFALARYLREVSVWEDAEAEVDEAEGLLEGRQEISHPSDAAGMPGGLGHRGEEGEPAEDGGTVRGGSSRRYLRRWSRAPRSPVILPSFPEPLYNNLDGGCGSCMACAREIS